MKFYLDEDLSPTVAEIARDHWGMDVVSAHEVGALEWPDELQLRRAAAEGRCMVTRNRDDLMAETMAAFEAQRPHAGLLIITRTLPNNRFAAIAAALHSYNERFPDGVPAYTLPICVIFRFTWH